MIKIENTYVDGFVTAVRGCRNPKNSWDLSDSRWEGNFEWSEFVIGPNDLKLLSTLAKAGDDHSKFLRMINVSCDITAPIYWIAEHDTYKVGTVRNSCSFMHKGVSRPFALRDFSINEESMRDGPVMQTWYNTLCLLNKKREEYLETKDEKVFQEIRQILPSGYNQKYTWSANYQVLRHIYHARKSHRLPEWQEFCKWIETLPYAEELICS